MSGAWHGAANTSRRERRRRRRRDRTRALLSGALVLGVGVSMTMAAWADGASVTGTFGTGRFNVLASVDGGTVWSEMSTAPGGTLAFPVNAGDIIPGETVYAPVLLKVDPAADTYDATVVLNGASVTAGAGTLATELRYGAKTNVAAASCNASSYAGAGSTLVALNTVLTTGSGATTFDLSKDHTAVGVCLAVTLPANATIAAAGDGITATWTFTMSSKDQH